MNAKIPVLVFAFLVFLTAHVADAQQPAKVPRIGVLDIAASGTVTCSDITSTGVDDLYITTPGTVLDNTTTGSITISTGNNTCLTEKDSGDTGDIILNTGSIVGEKNTQGSILFKFGGVTGASLSTYTYITPTTTLATDVVDASSSVAAPTAYHTTVRPESASGPMLVTAANDSGSYSRDVILESTSYGAPDYDNGSIILATATSSNDLGQGGIILAPGARQNGWTPGAATLPTLDYAATLNAFGLGIHKAARNGFEVDVDGVVACSGLVVGHPSLAPGRGNLWITGSGTINGDVMADDFYVGMGGLNINERPNSTMGTATLSGSGTATVNTTAVTANSRIFLTGQNSSGTHGELTISARTPGSDFTISSSSAADTRLIAWMIVEPY